MTMNRKGFTLVELLTVMAVIAILAGLVLSTAGYVQKKAASSRAQSEISALSAACESYKADNGIYPRTPTTGTNGIPANATDTLDPKKSGNPSAYGSASLYLYMELSGDRKPNDRKLDTGAKAYFEFPPAMLLPSGGTGTVTAISDPFGYSYGYSTSYQADVEAGTNPPKRGYNPTFDLWSTAGSIAAPNPTATPDTVTAKWIKNW